jgi:hypothetical protein
MRFKSAIQALVLSLSLAACGDSVSPYDGDWSGSWTSTDGQTVQSGPITFAIGNGELSGSGVNSQAGATFSAVGTVSSEGTASVTYAYPSSSYRADGSLHPAAGHLVGQFDVFIGAAKFGTGTIDVRPRF